jgi:hypothetical protein
MSKVACALISLPPQVAEERGFTKAGGGGDEGQFAVQTLVEALDQAGAEENSGPRRGDIEFSGQDWRRHRST